MKLVHLVQSLLFGVVVFGRAIEEQLADTNVVTGDADQLPYRFRYNVANPISGDYKSQTETRNTDGVVTGMYKVLQPDGCVRVVHYIADAMGFHPTVTYEGDCKRRGSISAASQTQSLDSTMPSTKEISTPMNPSTADLSGPVIGAVPGLINPLVTAVRSPAQDVFAAQFSPPLVSSTEAAPSQRFVNVTVATTLSPALSSPIASLGVEPLRPETPTSGSVSAVPTDENAVKSTVEREENHVGSWPEVLPTIQLPVVVNTTSIGHVQSPKQQQSTGPLAVPSVLTSEVESSAAVPYSILSLLKSFDAIETRPQNKDADRPSAPSSRFSGRPLNVEADPSVMSQAVEDTVMRDSIEVRESTPEVSAIQSATAETVAAASAETVQSTSVLQRGEVGADMPPKADETVQSKTFDQVGTEAIDPNDEKEPAKERFLGSLAHSALASVHNLTAPLTQLISSSVQNFSNPLATLMHSFNKNQLTSTVAPSTIPPAVEEMAGLAAAGKISIEGQTEDIVAERTFVETAITDHHQSETFPDGIDSDLPTFSEDSQQTMAIAESTRADEEQHIPNEESVELKQSTDRNIESISVEVDDPALVITSDPSTEIIRDYVESTAEFDSDTSLVSGTMVSDSDGIPVDAEGISLETIKLVSLERQPTEQVEADVRDASSWAVATHTESESAEAGPANDRTESYLLDSETSGLDLLSQSYAAVSDPVPAIYSQLQTAPFFVHQPVADYSSHAYPAPVRQSTARSVDSAAAMPYGLRVHAFVPNYGTPGYARPSYVYNQHRRHGQFYRPQPYVPYRRFVPVAPIRRGNKGMAKGMRYAAVQTSPMKPHYAVRLPAVQQPTPLYSTYAY